MSISFASRSFIRSDRITKYPLTTVFTAPESCTNVFDFSTPSNGPPTAELTLFDHFDTSCYARPVNGDKTYSPGLVCPHGWTSALTKLNDKFYQGSEWAEYTTMGHYASIFSMSELEYLLPNETAVLCCPMYVPALKY